MINLAIKNFAKFNLYFVFITLPIYYFARDFFPLSSSIYLIALLTSCLSCFLLNAQKDFYNRNIFFVIESLIFLNIILFFYVIAFFEEALLIFLAVMYLSRSLFISTQDIATHAPIVMIFSGLVGSIGIMLGLFELFFADTNYFYQATSFDYPYTDGIDQTILINGLFPSANGSAYCIGASLAFINFQKVFPGFTKKLIFLLLIVCLAATKTKFAVLFFMILLAIYCFSVFKNVYLYAILLCLGICYIFLSHIVLAPSGSYILPSVHFRELLFSIGEIDFVLGNYGIHKIYSFQAIGSHLFLPFGLDNFEEIYGSRPHFMLGSLIISGGISIALLISFYIFFILKRNFSYIVTGIRKNKIFISILFAFLVETINWNFANNFYFWGVLFGLFIVNIEKEHVIKKISI